MDFWSSVTQAAEKAAQAAKDLGKKGLEVVESTAEEANKKLNLNMYDKVGAGPPKGAPPSEQELAAFGVTPDFAEFVRTLNYSTFSDFPSDHLLPAEGSGGVSSSGGASGAYQLNPWQVRHATLVVQALKEVNELRFVLCPKYMTDEHFWHVYFTLARKYLPDHAFSWGPADVLPSFGEQQQSEQDAFSFAGLGDQLRQLSSKIQSAAAAAGATRPHLPSLSGAAGGGSSAALGAAGQAAAAGGAAAAAAGAAAAADSKPAPASGMLAEDPDLEAYLQVAISSSQPGSVAGDGEGGEDGYEGVGDDDDDLDLDLDSYLNELSAEVEAAEKEAEEQQQEAEQQGGGGAAEGAAAAAGGKSGKKD